MKLFIQNGGESTYPHIRAQTNLIYGEQIMNFQLQFGYGMMKHSRKLIDKWGTGGVILSPRDLTDDQLVRLSNDIVDRDGTVLFDPQCFIRDADHYRLTNHKYWQTFTSNSTSSIMGGAGAVEFLREVFELNKRLQTNYVIVPGVLADDPLNDWIDIQDALNEEAFELNSGKPLLATVAVSNSILKDESKTERIIEAAKEWQVDGFYIVPETPSSYLVDDPVWLFNLLNLSAGLKSLGKHVIVGYSNHQFLCLAVTGCDVMASGTWLNVRSFPPEKFYNPDEDDIARRATWYYCPDALSEYKINFLDMAYNSNNLDLLYPSSDYDSEYADPLFNSTLPSSVNWGERYAFRHYLHSLNQQVNMNTKGTFDDTFDKQMELIDSAEELNRQLRQNGIFGQSRDFHEFFDINRSAIIRFKSTRGALFRRTWDDLIS